MEFTKAEKKLLEVAKNYEVKKSKSLLLLISATVLAAIIIMSDFFGQRPIGFHNLTFASLFIFYFLSMIWVLLPYHFKACSLIKKLYEQNKN